jgi:hypothetical protein
MTGQRSLWEKFSEQIDLNLHSVSGHQIYSNTTESLYFKIIFIFPILKYWNQVRRS